MITLANHTFEGDRSDQKVKEVPMPLLRSGCRDWASWTGHDLPCCPSWTCSVPSTVSMQLWREG